MILNLLLTSSSIKNAPAPIKIDVWDLVADYCDETYKFKAG